MTGSYSGLPGGDASATEHRRLSEPAYHGSFISRYDELRPEPPAELIAALGSLAPANPPRLVVDLGSGTGISASAWSAHADQVLGIEHNPEMLAAARAAPRVEYRHALAQETGLPDACADIVTCAQSFHWMEHRATIEEIARILRPGGVFAAYDYDWPPLVDWEVDAAFLAVLNASGVDPERPEKARHIERLRGSGRFRWVREFVIHGRESRVPENIALLPLAFGPVARKLDEGATPEELGLDRLRDTIGRRLGTQAAPLWVELPRPVRGQVNAPEPRRARSSRRRAVSVVVVAERQRALLPQISGRLPRPADRARGLRTGGALRRPGRG